MHFLKKIFFLLQKAAGLTWLMKKVNCSRILSEDLLRTYSGTNDPGNKI